MMKRISAIVARCRAFFGAEDGQAATEYAAITSMMLWGLLGLAGGFPVFSKMLEAFDLYLDSIYYTLSLPLP